MTLEVIAFYHPQDPDWPRIQAWLQELGRTYPHRLVAIDITTAPALERQYKGRTPLLEVGPYLLRPPFSRETLQVTLAAALDGRQAQRRGKPSRQGGLSWGERFSYWLARNFLWLFLGFLTLYITLPWLAPVFMKIGWYGPARAIYRVYSFACHQLAFRSWFLFGEQPAYPRAAAGVPGLKTFQEATGLSEGDDFDSLMAARAFIGNEKVGYKTALCQRDIAIWTAYWLFTLIFLIAYKRGRRIPHLPWYLWLLGWVPIGLDGFSQLLSQMPWWGAAYLPYRESTPLLRTLTGFIFGWTTAWFMVPLIAESMEETEALFRRKQHILEARQKSTPTDH